MRVFNLPVFASIPEKSKRIMFLLLLKLPKMMVMPIFQVLLIKALPAL
jgi:hypothetical protein